MKYILLLLFVLFSSTAFANTPTDSLLKNLDTALGLEQVYVKDKLQSISILKEKILRNKPPLAIQWEIYNAIFEEYKSFKYDSAFTYIRKLQDIAYQVGDEEKINSTKIKLGFIFLSSGMFKEAFDSLRTIRKATLIGERRIEYYSLMAILHYGLSDLNDRYYAPLYEAKGHEFADSVLKYSEEDTYSYLYYRGLKSARKSDLKEGLSDLEQLITRDSLTLHQRAIISSTLSDIYLRMGEKSRAFELLAMAAIYDIRSATKETAAILNLADMLYLQGDIKRAYTYTKKALADANFYGARQRKIQVGTILSIIEEEKLDTVESQKRSLIMYSVIVSFLSICVVVFVLITLKQLRKLRKAENEILETNKVLQETNHELLEANKIKEEYIGYYFNINSDYIDKIEKFKKSVDKNLRAKNFDSLRYAINSIDLKKERVELYQSFDKVFLKLFPCFISNFNALFKEEDQIKLRDYELLNTDLRIFALIRMGISENDKIAKILEFSVNTIYTYKTRIKNKAIVPNDEFEAKIMEIKPI